MDYRFTNNVPNKDKLFDNVSTVVTDNIGNSNEAEIGSSFVSDELDKVEVEMTKNKEGNYLIWTGSVDKKSIGEEQEEEPDKNVLYPATQLYVSGMTVVGLFILYRLMMRYK